MTLAMQLEGIRTQLNHMEHEEDDESDGWAIKMSKGKYVEHSEDAKEIQGLHKALLKQQADCVVSIASAKAEAEACDKLVAEADTELAKLDGPLMAEVRDIYRAEHLERLVSTHDECSLFCFCNNFGCAFAEVPLGYVQWERPRQAVHCRGCCQTRGCVRATISLDDPRPM